MFERFVTWCSVEFAAELKGSKIRRWLIFCHSSVALAAVDVYLAVSVFSVTMDDVFAGECVVFFKRIVSPKSVRIDGQRLLVVISKQESNGRFVGGFRWHDVPIVRATIDQRNTDGLSPSYDPRPRVDWPRERDSWSRLRPLRPAETYTSSISTGPDSLIEGGSSALAKRSTRRLTVLYERSSSASICRILVLNRKKT